MNRIEKYAHRQPDRRELPETPSRKTDRRREARYEGEFDVRILVGSGTDRRTYTARAKNISNGGIRLANVDIPEDESRLRLDFLLPSGVMPEGFEARVRVPARSASMSHSGREIGLQFERPLEEELRRRRWTSFRIIAVGLLLLALLLISLIKLDSIFYFWFDVPLFLYGLCATGFLLSRFGFASLYRSYPVSREYTPGVTIVIPCYNEEEYIERTVHDCLNQDYPEEQLKLIVVNDGSADGSHGILTRLAERYSSMTYVSLEKNVGKRRAMSVGVELATTELLVFVDSDSFLEADAIRSIVQPMRNPDIAACSGHCEVENKWTNWLTKMQAVRYYIAFRVLKGAESIFDSVTVLSGPLSCYRQELLLEVRDRWVNQKFLGTPATFGDDRSLTNFLLPKHQIVYQSTAVCNTIVPSNFNTFLHQQMRWKRSWIRENVRASWFMWRKQPFMALSFYLGFILPMLGPLVAFRALVLLPLWYNTAPLIYLLGIFLMSAVMSSTYLWVKRSSLWFYGVPFCFFYLFVLLWQLPIALLTFWTSNWGTRNVKSGGRPPKGRQTPKAE